MTPDAATDPRIALLDRWADELTVGDRQRTRGRTVTEADIVNWCALTGDWFEIHSNTVVAERSVFGQRIAPGVMVLALSGGLGVPPATPSVVANYGFDRVRFVAPTFIGDTVYVDIEVQEKLERKDTSTLVSFDWSIVDHRDRFLCSCVLKLLMRSAPT